MADYCLTCVPLHDYERHAEAPACVAHRYAGLCHVRSHVGSVDRADGRGRVCMECGRARCRRRHDGKYDVAEAQSPPPPEAA